MSDEVPEAKVRFTIVIEMVTSLEEIDVVSIDEIGAHLSAYGIHGYKDSETKKLTTKSIKADISFTRDVMP